MRRNVAEQSRRPKKHGADSNRASGTERERSEDSGGTYNPAQFLNGFTSKERRKRREDIIPGRQSDA